ncbi:hypothetical protein HOG21_00680 [bacterium]|nr:hypothetical protein [bacterium]
MLSLSSAIHIQVSIISNLTLFFCLLALIITFHQDFVNLIAFVNRFSSTCFNLSLSVFILYSSNFSSKSTFRLIHF